MDESRCYFIQCTLAITLESFKSETLNPAVALYNSSIIALADQHVPLKTRTITLHPNAPWYNGDLKQEKWVCLCLGRQASSTNLQGHGTYITSSEQK